MRTGKHNMLKYVCDVCEKELPFGSQTLTYRTPNDCIQYDICPECHKKFQASLKSQGRDLNAALKGKKG